MSNAAASPIERVKGQFAPHKPVSLWSLDCSVIALAVPVVIVLSLFPDGMKPIVGIIWVAGTFLGGLWAPPVGLFGLLVGIVESPILFASQPGGSNWGKYCALAFFLSLWFSRRKLLKYPKELWLFILPLISIVAAPTDSGVLGYEYYFDLLILPAIFMAAYFCARSLNRFISVLVVLLAFGQTILVMTILHGDFTVRVSASIFAGYGNTNDLAQLFAVLVPIAFAINLVFQKNKYISYWSGLTIVMLFTFTIVAASRGAILGLAVGLLFIILKSRPTKTLLLIFFTGITILLIPSEYVERVYLRATNQIVGAEMSYWKHIELNRDAMDAFKKKPVFGYGWKQSNYVMGALYNYSSGDQNTAVHNTYLQVAVELGLVGLAFFISLNMSAFYKLFGLRKSPISAVRFLSWNMIACLIIFGISNGFISFLYNRLLYVVLGLSFALINIAKSGKLLEQRTIISPAYGPEGALPKRPFRRDYA